MTDDILAMSEEELRSRKNSINKQDLIKALCAAKDRMISPNVEGLSELIADRVKEAIEPVLERLLKVSDELKQLREYCRCLEEDLQIHKQEKQELLHTVSTEVEQRAQRRNNVIISGVVLKMSGSVEERRSDDLKQCREILEHLECPFESVEDVRRIGRPGGSSRPLLKVVFSNFLAKREVLRRTTQLRRSEGFRNVYVNIDRTPLQQKQHKLLMQECRKRNERGENVVIFREEIVSRNSLQNFRKGF